MASSSSSRSSSSSSTVSSSSSSLSSSFSKGARARTLPRRGQVKAAIFASIVTAFARFLGARTPDASQNGANSQDGVGSPTPLSDFRLDVVSADEGGGFGLSVRSSPASMSSGSITPNSSFQPLPRPRSFHEGMNGN